MVSLSFFFLAYVRLIIIKYKFDLKYAFFIVMGGVRIDAKNLKHLIWCGDADPEFKTSLEREMDRDDPSLLFTLVGGSVGIQRRMDLP